LEPIEWTKAIRLTGKGSPFVGEILETAFNHAKAVVVLLSPDDEARLHPDFVQATDASGEILLSGQARPNVLFEAGMAFGLHPHQTVLVQFGEVRPFSDIAGRHIVRMDNSFQKRHELALRLQGANCSVDMSGTDWHTSGDLTPPNRSYAIAPSPVGLARTQARIAFSRIPVAGGGPDSRGTFKGVVVGLPSPERHKIVLFALTDKWYVQPLISNPFTGIDADGFWENWTHLGERYAALLVRKSFKPPPTADTLPDVGGQILAKSETAPYGGPNPLP
jgi:hypothetical protein